MQILLRRRPVVLATSAIALGCLSLVIGTAAFASESFDSGGSPSIEEIDAFSFFDRTSPITATVDLSHPSAGPALESSMAALEGMTIQVTGVAVDSPEERRKQDEMLSNFDVVAPESDLDPCGDVPIGEFCGSSGSVPIKDVVDSMMRELATTGNRDAGVEFDGGHVSIDLPSFEPLVKHDGFVFNHRLTAALLANGEVRTLEISVDGDCLLYARLVGMDQCIRVNRADLEAHIEDVK